MRRAMRFIENHLSLTIAILIVTAGLAWAATVTLDYGLGATINTLLKALDTDGDGAISDEAWFTGKQDTADMSTDVPANETDPVYSAVTTATEVQAEDRTSTTVYNYTPQRIGQAIFDLLADIYGWDSPLTAEPTGEYVGTMLLADSTWDPAGVGQDAIVLCTSTGDPGTWVALVGVDGTWYTDIPLYVEQGATLEDTSSPHELTASEMMNTVISNADATGAEEYDAPAYSSGAGWNVIFICEEAQNMIVDPNGTEQWYLNGTQGTAGQNIGNTACTKGESMTCIGGIDTVYCKSGDSDWAFQ